MFVYLYLIQIKKYLGKNIHSHVHAENINLYFNIEENVY